MVLLLLPVVVVVVLLFFIMVTIAVTSALDALTDDVHGVAMVPLVLFWLFLRFCCCCC